MQVHVSVHVQRPEEGIGSFRAGVNRCLQGKWLDMRVLGFELMIMQQALNH